ncbi:MAG: hypothetical protein DMG42_29800 [Acidobacteria bacterium]|nr:MAG: hypothetical protein AUH13_19375 [Acidobacteria bacterium 13_2_20CM_58_27]PYT66261.1 MAG: hypothetical protein DMG42_29800 [Acidobacteriota bacterium]
MAGDVLKEWKKERGSESPFVFPSPRSPGKPIRSVKHAWPTTLKNAGVPYFPIYNRAVSTNILHFFARVVVFTCPDRLTAAALPFAPGAVDRR